jgi:hypothetical protein
MILCMGFPSFEVLVADEENSLAMGKSTIAIKGRAETTGRKSLGKASCSYDNENLEFVLPNVSVLLVVVDVLPVIST